MADPSLPYVLIIANPQQAEELANALAELRGGIDLPPHSQGSAARSGGAGAIDLPPHSQGSAARSGGAGAIDLPPHSQGSAARSGGAGAIEIVTSPGGDHAIELFRSLRPRVVVMAATLELGDAKSLMATLGSIVARTKVGFVLVGDEKGPVSAAIDAIDYAPDRFVPRPVAPSALRVAVRSALDAVTQRSRPGTTPGDLYGDPAVAKVAQRARWEALADIIGESEETVEPIAGGGEAAPLPPLFEISPRGDHEPIVRIEAWGPESGGALARTRESARVIRDAPPDERPERARAPTNPPPIPAIRSRGLGDGSPVRLSRRTSETAEDDWSEPTPLSEMGERVEDDALAEDVRAGEALSDVDSGISAAPGTPVYDIGEFDDPDLIVPTPVPSAPHDDRGPGRDFARELRAKMSLMAKRLFHNDGAVPEPVEPASQSRGNGAHAGGAALDEVEPRRVEATDADLAAFGEVHALDRVGVTTVEPAGVERRERVAPASSPRSWTTQVRESGLPDAGELVRGVSDAAFVLATLFARKTTGRATFRQDDIEKVVYVDAGRPVFASSNGPGDRMGELLVREGKITAAQYDRCQADVQRSGRRIGEILIDFGYLKRRELLPAVRRHVEDIVFSLFGWVRGTYQITADPAASSERIRMSRHPASLVLEGIRRKLDRATLERLVGPPSTVIDLANRDRLGRVVNASDLADEERAALAAFDGRADLAAVARTANVDVADVLPLAWGLYVLGLATARRTDADEPSTMLVGETDLAIDRERIRARWELVAEADYFALLGVRRDATAFEIRRAYQLARRDFAADGFPVDLRRELSRELAEIATVLDEAFRVMRDDALRVMYLSQLPE